VDEAAAGGELCCLDCSTAIELDRARGLAPAAADQAAVATRPVVTEAEEVVCPRCKLHFSPRRGASREDADDRPVVLVVEDMEFFREAAADALGTHCEVLTAASVDEALGLLGHRRIDLLVLDLTLDGGENGRALMRTASEKPCPILIFTAKDESEMYGDSWEELQRLGADDMVIKNMQAGESLLRKAGELLGRSFEPD